MKPKPSTPVLSDGDAEMLAETACTYDGKTLHPFNARRVYAAGAMGVRFLKFTPPDWQAFLSSGIYAEAAMDCAVVVYLCLQPEGTALRALTNPQAVLVEAIDWADAEGLHFYGSEKSAEAGRVFGAMIRSLFKNLTDQELPPEEVSLRAKGGKKKP